MTVLSISWYVSYFVFPELKQLGIIWKTYINPLTQLIYFLSGMVMAQVLWKKEVKQPVVSIIIIIVSALFLLIPVSERVDLIIGNNRLIFSILAIIICWCFFKLRIQLPNFIQIPLKYIGDISYSIYLIHPIVYWGFKVLFIQLQFIIPFHYLIPLSMIGTIGVSHLVYSFIEKPMVKVGKSITQRLNLA
jgi:peptidoglycan/LPS O-acetylase OafA/YrhL